MSQHTSARGRPFTPESAATYGRRGGLTTAQRHGLTHMRQIGARGFAATVARHWDGDRRAYLAHLQRLGLMAVDPMPYNGAWTRPPLAHASRPLGAGVAVCFAGPDHPWPEEPPF